MYMFFSYQIVLWYGSKVRIFGRVNSLSGTVVVNRDALTAVIFHVNCHCRTSWLDSFPWAIRKREWSNSVDSFLIRFLLCCFLLVCSRRWDHEQALMDNSDTWGNKTQYSQAKWLKRKQQKWEVCHISLRRELLKYTGDSKFTNACDNDQRFSHPPCTLGESLSCVDWIFFKCLVWSSTIVSPSTPTNLPLVYLSLFLRLPYLPLLLIYLCLFLRLLFCLYVCLSVFLSVIHLLYLLRAHTCLYLTKTGTDHASGWSVWPDVRCVTRTSSRTARKFGNNC